jgi:hypothetical protein
MVVTAEPSNSPALKKRKNASMRPAGVPSAGGKIPCCARPTRNGDHRYTYLTE